jgi:hypothetical protein
MNVVWIVLFFLLLTGWDLPQLLKKDRRKDLVVYSLLMAAGLALSILVSFHVHLPNPTNGLEAIFKPFRAVLQKD